MNHTPQPESLWRQDESLRHLEARLNEQPRTFRVVSFDFFDTLVYRLCGEPADLFIELGRRLAEKALLKSAVTPTQFQATRMEADHRARRKAQCQKQTLEIGLPAIYEQLGSVVTDRKQAMEVELQTERDFTFLNPVMAELVQYVRSLGLKTVITSDTYFSREHLLALMGDLGLPATLFDRVFLSNESGGAKWDGQLFREACRQLDIHPNEMLHLGDNPNADVRMATAVGVEAVPYYRTTPRLDHMFGCEKNLRSAAPPTAAGLHFVRTLVARLATSDQDTYRDGALVFGPVLTQYADWCVQQFRNAGVTRVLALMREGELLGTLLTNAAQAANIDLDVVPCFVSRQSTACASLSEVTVPQLEELLEGNCGLTLHAILEILGIVKLAEPHLNRALLFKPLVTASAIRGVLRLLAEPGGLHDLVESSRIKHHELAFAYLHNLTKDQDRIGVIDLGWSGSIQRNLTRILRLGKRQIKSIGCYLATTPRAARLFLDGDEAHAFLPGEWKGSTILPETAINACIGSTQTYRRTPEGKVLPVLSPFNISQEERTLKERLRDGVLSYQLLWHHIQANRKPEAITRSMQADCDTEIQSILQRLIDFPSPSEAVRLGRLTHDENYWGERLTRPLCATEGPGLVRREGIQGLFLKPDSYWPQGVVALSHPRLVSGLARGWQDGVALGRLGANPAGTDPTISTTQEELASLQSLLQRFAPQQIVTAGLDPRMLQGLVSGLVDTAGRIKPLSDLNDPCRSPANSVLDSRPPLPDVHLWSQALQDEPLLLVLGESDNRRGEGSRPEPASLRMRGVPGRPDHPETLRSARAQLGTHARIALVLSDELKPEARIGIVNGLAPFLGPQGLILTARGRTFHEVADTEHVGTQHLMGWLEQMGSDLGYEPWHTSEDQQLDLVNWLVLLRGQAIRESAPYWSLDLAGLPALPPSTENEPALLSAQALVQP